MLEKNSSEMVALLKRVRTFTKLYFYNNELVNPYTLASHGFIEDQKNQNQSKCENCRSVIKFDSFDELSELKDPLDYFLKDHEDDCKFYHKNCGKLFSLSKKTLVSEGILLYKDIYLGYLNNSSELKQKFLICEAEIQHLEKVKALYEKFDKDFENGQISIKNLLSLFGWRKKSELQLYCEYCGQSKEIKEGEQFEFIGNHKINCYLIDENNWEVLLKSIVIEQLQNIEGQFNKTFGQIEAKRIRTQLINFTKQNFQTTLSNYKFNIQQIKNQYQVLEQDLRESEKKQRQERGEQENSDQLEEGQEYQSWSNNGKRNRTNKELFQELSAMGEKVSDIIKFNIKKVKVD